MKVTLTKDEIQRYKELRSKINTARTRTEVSVYTQQAKAIIEGGKRRYVDKLERKKINA